MRILAHCGLHKSASTNLQHLLHGHRDALIAGGIYYDFDGDFAAHHRVAWSLLAGDVEPCDRLLSRAAAHGADYVILSSEDLEGVLFDAGAARRLQASAARAGASLEWHMVLRDPGTYFVSLFAQLQCHVYADALTMFAEIMNKGGLYMHDPAPNWGGTPFWYYSFDHLRDLSRFAAETGHRIVAYDYRDGRPFPGWRILERVGALDLIGSMPGEAGQNRRHSTEVVLDGYRARIAEAGGTSLQRHVDAAVAASTASLEECAQLISERFGDSHAQALAAFGPD
ncbi:MAG: hypothetical protein EOO77_17535 [Oxalobacteraceae bacterium]|nr:MAG: hypothetical protein EOO77_17535 [Oxalobacteraceae bacterium]